MILTADALSNSCSCGAKFIGIEACTISYCFSGVPWPHAQALHSVTEIACLQYCMPSLGYKKNV